MSRLTVYSELKKYEKMNGYSCNSYSPSAMIKHLSLKFKFSEYELHKAHTKNKIRFKWTSE